MARLRRAEWQMCGDRLDVAGRPTKIMIDGEWMTLETRQTSLRDRYADINKGARILVIVSRPRAPA
jgi:hypothetical protein